MTNETNQTIKSVKPLSLRLNFEQRSQLEKEADGLPVSTYVKIRLFGSGKADKDTRIPRPLKDRQEFGRLLGVLGQSNIAANLQELTDAAASGSLVIDETSTAMLQTATQDLREIRDLLVKALGIRG